MSIIVQRSLPYDLVILIISYDNRFAIRNGRIMDRIDLSKGIYRNIINVYSILSFAYYSRYDELEEDVVIELPINENKLYLIQCCAFLEDDNSREINRFLSIKNLDHRVDEEKLLTIY
jgi:hypothetical protein